MKKLFTAAGVYFLLVFSAGFVLGPIRMFMLAPRLGTRTAELFEMPFMLAVTVMAAIWTVRRFAVAAKVSRRLAMGLIALALVSIAELAVMISQGLTVKEYWANRDPVSGPVFYLMLIVFAAMPSLVARQQKSGDTGPSLKESSTV